MPCPLNRSTPRVHWSALRLGVIRDLHHRLDPTGDVSLSDGVPTVSQSAKFRSIGGRVQIPAREKAKSLQTINSPHPHGLREDNEAPYVIPREPLLTRCLGSTLSWTLKHEDNVLRYLSKSLPSGQHLV